MVRRGLLIGFSLAALAGFAPAQTAENTDSVLPGRPDQVAEALDSPFLSSAAVR